MRAQIKAAIPLLRKTKGRVVFTSSGAAVGAYTAWGAYGSSKAALNSLTQHLAVEEPDIASVAIGPGRVNTDMQKELREQGSSSMAPKEYASFVEAFEAGTLNKPEWPAQVMGKLVLEAKPELRGKYFKFVARVPSPSPKTQTHFSNREQMGRTGIGRVQGEVMV